MFFLSPEINYFGGEIGNNLMRALGRKITHVFLVMSGLNLMRALIWNREKNIVVLLLTKSSITGNIGHKWTEFKSTTITVKYITILRYFSIYFFDIMYKSPPYIKYHKEDLYRSWGVLYGWGCILLRGSLCYPSNTHITLRRRYIGEGPAWEDNICSTKPKGSICLFVK